MDKINDYIALQETYALDCDRCLVIIIRVLNYQNEIFSKHFFDPVRNMQHRASCRNLHVSLSEYFLLCVYLGYMLMLVSLFPILGEMSPLLPDRENR